MHISRRLSLTIAAVIAAAGLTALQPGTASATSYGPQIINRNSGKCLEVYHSSTSDGAKVDQWTCNNTRTQNWHFVLVGTSQNENVYEIVNNNSEKCLEIPHSVTNAGAAADQWTCNGTATQHWQYHNPPTGVGIMFLNMNSGMILEVAHSSTADGATVDQYYINYTDTQHWDRPILV